MFAGFLLGDRDADATSRKLGRGHDQINGRLKCILRSDVVYDSSLMA